jgi:hypothetical protein
MEDHKRTLSRVAHGYLQTSLKSDVEILHCVLGQCQILAMLTHKKP